LICQFLASNFIKTKVKRQIKSLYNYVKVKNGASMFMGQWKCYSWNIHHTVPISILKTLHLFQHDTFFSIYWYFSYQYISINKNDLY
jgi:hypothetical protein